MVIWIRVWLAIQEEQQGNAVDKAKESELEEFVNYAKIIMGTLGHRVFIPLTKADPSDTPKEAEAMGTNEGTVFYLTRAIKQYNITIHAQARQTSERFVVLAGSIVSPEDDNTI